MLKIVVDGSCFRWPKLWPFSSAGNDSAGNGHWSVEAFDDK